MTLDVVSVHRKATFLILPRSSTHTQTHARTHTMSAASGFAFRWHPSCRAARVLRLLFRGSLILAHFVAWRSPFPIIPAAVRPQVCLFICQRSRLRWLTANRSETRARVPLLECWTLPAVNAKCWTPVIVGYVLKNEQVPFWFVFGLLLCFSSGKHVAHTYTQTKTHSCVEEVWLEHSFQT